MLTGENGIQGLSENLAFLRCDGKLGLVPPQVYFCSGDIKNLGFPVLSTSPNVGLAFLQFHGRDGTDWVS
jgi:hypothetical protein